MDHIVDRLPPQPIIIAPEKIGNNISIAELNYAKDGKAVSGDEVGHIEKPWGAVAVLADGVGSSNISISDQTPPDAFASHTAVSVVLDRLNTDLQLGQNEQTIKQIISNAYSSAGHAIFEATKHNTKGICATTLRTAVLIGKDLYIASVGDGRSFVYRAKTRTIESIGVEDTKLAAKIRMKNPRADEATIHKLYQAQVKELYKKKVKGTITTKESALLNTITKAIGVNDGVSTENEIPQIYKLNIEEGDIVFHISDGASDTAFPDTGDDSLMLRTINKVLTTKPIVGEIVDEIMKEALANSHLKGSGDDISISALRLHKNTSEEVFEDLEIEQLPSLPYQMLDIITMQVIKEFNAGGANRELVEQIRDALLSGEVNGIIYPIPKGNLILNGVETIKNRVRALRREATIILDMAKKNEDFDPEKIGIPEITYQLVIDLIIRNLHVDKVQKDDYELAIRQYAAGQITADKFMEICPLAIIPTLEERANIPSLQNVMRTFTANETQPLSKGLLYYMDGKRAMMKDLYTKINS